MSNEALVKVEDIMLINTFSMADGMLTVADAIALTQKEQTTALIINKRNDDDEYGLVLLSDIAKQVLAANRAPERVNLYEIMAKPVLFVPPTMQVKYCARLFERFGIGVAPVIDNNKILGMVSYTEMVLRGYS